MFRKLSLLLLLTLALQSLFAQETYDKVRIWSQETNQILTELLELGIDPEGIDVRPGVYIDAIVSQYERQGLADRALLTEDIITDVSSYYASRLTQGAARELGYGSMGGYLTFDEIVESMDSLHALFPDIVSAKQSIGSSIEGRDIWAFKISDSPNAPDGDPEVLYNSLIHAREPAAMMTLMHFAWTLAESYQIDPTLTYLVDEREIWFIPVINPDGYVYNQLTNPNGGGMHRKNRRPGCTSQPGVDLNRNWGHYWGHDDVGSSPDSCGNTYRGYAAFSEPETEAVRDFVLSHDFQTAFNYHSYGDLLIKPFGYDEAVELPAPANEIYAQMGPDLVEENDYLFGTGSETVGYMVNGDAVDYMFGELDIINYTPEVGAWAAGGFWPPTELIFEMAEENLPMNIHLAGCAGSWVEVESFELISDGSLETGDVVYSELILMNKGVGLELSEAMLFLESPDSSIIPSQSFLNVSDLPSQVWHDYGTEDLSFEVNAPHGGIAQLVLSIEMAGYETQVETFKWTVGAPDTLFFDSFESGSELWSSDSWGAEISADGAQYLTDSPMGFYEPEAVSAVVLASPLDLRGYNNPILQFDASWDIEVNYDFCQLLVSTDGGDNWIPMEGMYTDTGNGATVQPPGEPGYHGSQDWITEEIALSQFAGISDLLLSFRLMSDTYYEGDGFKVDNLAILGWGPGYLLGDITGDGVIDVSDAIILLEAIISSGPYSSDLIERADTNEDLVLDVRDLIILVEIILNS